METNKKIIGNAVSAYFMLFVSGLFLFDKKNPLIHNDFVKSHTKTALLIHTLFLVIALFAYFGIGSSIDILDFSINRIIVTVLFLGVFGIMLYAVYEAQKGESFTIGDILHLTSQEKLLEIKTKKNLQEQEKLGLILAGIPFIGFYLSAQHSGDLDFQKRVHSNLIISLIIAFCIIVKAPNLGLLILLSYIIFVVFSSIALLIKEEIVNLSLEVIPSVEKLEIGSITLFHYFGRYFGKRDFESFHSIYETVKTQRSKNDFETTITDIHFPFFCIYLPLIGIFFIKTLTSKYQNHYKNNLGITVLMALAFAGFGFESWIPYLVVFPLSFGLGRKEDINYKTPFCYSIGNTICHTFSIVFHLGKKAREVQKKEEKVTIEVKQKATDFGPEKTQ